jgi:ABC-2 type transport system permease protein
MKKYLTLLKQSFSYASSYRLQIIISLIHGFITPALMLVALSFANPVQGYQLQALVPYYLVVGTIFPLVYSSVDEEMDDLGSTGDINNFLTRPLGLHSWLLIKSVGEKLSSLFFISPILLLLLLFFYRNIQTPVNFLYLTISLSISFLIYFNVSYLTGLFSFWVDEFWAIHNVKYVVMQLLGGFIIPLSLFPTEVAAFIARTPFYFIGGWNATVIQNGLKLTDVFVGLFWILAIRLISVALEQKAISKYSFTGS